MSISFKDGIAYEGKSNNFERDYFEVLNDVIDPTTQIVLKKGMLNVKKAKMPNMFIAMCGETGKTYLWDKINNTEDPTWKYWRELSGNASGASNLKYYATIQEMAEDTITDDVALGYVAEDEKTYMYLSTNDPDPTTGKWRVFVAGGTANTNVTTYGILAVDPSDPPTTGYNDGDYLYDCTNDMVYLYNATWVEEFPAQGEWIYSFEEVAEVPSGTTPTDVVDINSESASASTVDIYYHDTTTDKYYVGIKTWHETAPATGHYDYSVTDVTGEVNMIECMLTQSLYDGLDNSIKMRNVTWYVD
jgi:hypothetical protein